MSSWLLEAQGLQKSFPGVRALRGVDLRVGQGEVLAVIGENGAGKSTLMKILAGVQRPDSGEVFIQGARAAISSVHDALAHGIALIHQELNLADNLDVAANIFLGRERRWCGLMGRRSMERKCKPFLESVGLQVNPRKRVGDLPLGQQQLVEIAKALSTQARVLIMDEPTSSLSAGEAENLFGVIHDLRSRGVSILYISHRLGEVQLLADRVTVLRDGANSGELKRSEISHAAMVRLMVGRDLSQVYPHLTQTTGEVSLDVERLRTPAHPRQEISFQVRSGEVVGLAGLVGAGRTELLTTLFGVTPAVGGTMRIAGQEIRPKSPRQAIAAGMALVPEDRKRQGVVLPFSVRDNLSLAALRWDCENGWLNPFLDKARSRAMIAAMRIKTPSDNQPVLFLSGGNQQKVVLGKWLATNPRVLLLDEPTRGIDVGARQEIYRIMDELADQGVAILFASSEMEEVLGMSDRVLVMHEGRLAGELTREELSEEAVMALATGRNKEDASSEPAIDS